ncbi:MAG: GAF domain-containing protein [Deltaproteobacteria bacterium]|nr:GAF domain-containing protein [Deltaproteobacteria bacterium]
MSPADFFQTLVRLSQAFGTAHNRRELLDLIFKAAMDTLDGRAACLYLAEPGKRELIPVAQKGLSETYFRSRKSMLARKIVATVQKEGFLYSRDAAADPRLEHREAKKAEGIASILAAPVMVKGQNIGVFCLFTAAPRDFSPEEIQFLTLLAQQSGGVMEHARLLDLLRRETQLFLDLAAKFTSTLDVREILNFMAADLAAALKVKAAAILLLNEDKQTLELVSSYGLSEPYLKKGPVSAAQSIAQTLNGKPTLIRDATTDKRVQYREMNKEEGIVSILSVPLKTREKAIGALRLYTAAPRDFTRDEIMLVTALAYLGGLAIQNASLYLRCQTDMEDLQDELWSHRSWF